MNAYPMEETAPVRCIVDAAELLTLCLLLRQAIPMLRRPQDYGVKKRQELAHTMSLCLFGLDAGLDEEETDEQNDDD